jgi:hypothetical protein
VNALQLETCSSHGQLGQALEFAQEGMGQRCREAGGGGPPAFAVL